MGSETADVIVTDQQRQQLDEQGYFITDVLFDEPTLQGVRNEFIRLWENSIAAAQKSGDALTIDQARFRSFMSQLDRLSPTCDAFCRHPTLLDICREVLGDDVDLTWNQSILKAPQKLSTTDTAFAWHQDMWYATHGTYIEDTNPEIFFPNETGLTIWIAVTRTTVDNGTLWVLPGRHKEGLLPHVFDESKREWKGEFDTSWKVPAVMRAGQALVFRKYLPHASGANTSDEVRMAYQLGYARPGLKKGASIDLSPVLRDGKPV